MKLTKEDLADGIVNLNNLLSYIKEVEGTEQFPAIIADWNLLNDKEKTIVALMSMSMLADFLIKEDNNEN